VTNLEIINSFSISLLQQNSLDDLMWSMAENIGELLEFEDCVIYLKEGDVLSQMAAYGIKNPAPRDIKSRIQIKLGEGIVGTAAKTGILENVTDLSSDTRYIHDEFSGKSELAVPLKFENEVIGILDSESSRKNGFSKHDVDMLQSLANIAAPRIDSAISHREKERTEDELRKAMLAAEESSQAKSEFLSRMSHELRTPLNAILGFAEILKIKSNDMSESHLDHIIIAGQHLLMLMDEMLDIVQIEQNYVTLNRSNFSVEPLIQECILLTRFKADEMEIVIDTDIASLSVYGDSQRFKQIMLNLLSNAVKYNHKGGQIHISAFQGEDNHIRVEVEDTGIGIASDELKLVFEPFTRFGLLQGEVEGVGIGMLITKQLIEIMGGEISVSSELSRGTTVTFSLPQSLEVALPNIN
jgi:signal transduction histidine kinase